MVSFHSAIRASVVAFLVLGVTPGCGASRQPSALFALQWRGAGPNAMPNKTVADALKNHLIKLQPLNDARADLAKIGEWENDNKKAVRTDTNVAQFVHDNLSSQLKGAGAKLVKDGETVEMRGEIIEFNVQEGGMFNGDIRMRFNVVVGGRATWEGTFNGKSKRWGRTHNPDNFNEALTNALQEVTRQLLSDDGFAKALTAVPTSGGAAVPPAPAAAPAPAPAPTMVPPK